MQRKNLLKVVLAATIVAGVILLNLKSPEAQHMLSRVGNAVYSDTLKGAGDRIARDFYLNSSNSRSSPVKYDGYAALKVQVDSLHATDSDSLTIVVYKLDLNGTASEDSFEVVSLWNWTDDKPVWYRLDNLPGYNMQPGLKMVLKNENTVADTFIVKSEIWYY